MTPNDYLALLPLLVTGVGAIVIMLITAFFRSHSLIVASTTLLLAGGFASLFVVSGVVPQDISSHTAGEGISLLKVTGFSLIYTGIILGCSFAITLLSFGYLEQYPEQKEEYYILLLIATFGAIALVNAHHFIALFLGLEVLSIALYALIAYLRQRSSALEAGTKYLIMASTSSAFLLFGMALIYNAVGTMEFMIMAARLSSVESLDPLFIGGLAIMIVGIGFKLALVPFHLWTPDVYQGAPAPVTALIATISKGSMFGVWLRFYTILDGGQYASLITIFSVVAIASMLLGNLLALLQDNVKRVLAYSSIAHLGYILVGFLASSNLGAQAATFYLIAYFITTLGSFGIIAVMSSGGEEDAEDISNYEGLFWTRPLLALVFTAMLLSLAGIPLTAGFIGKYYVLTSGIDSDLWYLVITLVAGSAIGLYYYLRIIAVMFRPSPEANLLKPQFNAFNTLALALLTVMVVWYGVYPTGMISLINTMMGA